MNGIFERIIHFEEMIFNDGPNGISVHSINFVYSMLADMVSAVKLDDTSSDYRWIDSIDEIYHPYVMTGLKHFNLPNTLWPSSL